ncbi:hypothetical protein, partial [Vibrio parahaemolyticus]|uniref:hypothetical protein n=1 Tax=Vibrio parahaemolyticus TaxID=670 RepID=UPI001D14F269
EKKVEMNEKEGNGKRNRSPARGLGEVYKRKTKKYRKRKKALRRVLKKQELSNWFKLKFVVK